MWLVFQPEVVLVSPKEGKPISKTGSDRHGDRWKVVHAWEKRVAKGLSTDDKPGWSQIARECNKPRCFVERWVTRFRETGSIQDLETIGRKAGHGLKLGVSGLKRAHQYVSQPHGTAGKTASKLAKEGFPMVSRVTIARAVKTVSFPNTKMDEPLCWKLPKKTVKLSLPNKQARIGFCNRHRDRSWKLTLFTDSSIFEPPNSTKNKGIGPGRWVKQSETHEEPVPKHAPFKVHVYGGISYHGKTELHIVTGTTGHKLLDHCLTGGPKGPRGQPTPCKGVCNIEYNTVLTQTILPGGDAIFGGREWTLQQDGAKIHWTPNNVLTIKNHMADRVIDDWPANSPDLSPIENVWALMDWQLKMSGEYDLSTMKLPEYKAAVLAEWESVCTPELLKKLCGGMHKRMRECIAQKGEKIKK